jgi:hypothetical protein
LGEGVVDSLLPKLLRLNDKEARNETARDKVPDELEIEKAVAGVS